MVLPKALEKICVRAVLKGGAIASRYFQTEFRTSFKHSTHDSSSIVTEADLHSEKEIRKIIRGAFP
ncbi:TPA: hypothetical protein HA244_02960, partial [Candidatus Micrarchaeota archaeon]|nr:hypothetical protein [Candidatus Micrarchaeota archaeon]